MARPTNADSAQTYDQIVRAVLEVLEETGIHKLSVRAVAARAGVSTGTVQYYFVSKDELLEACLDEYYERLSEEGRQLLALVPTDGRDIIEMGARRLFRFAVRERRLVELRLAMNSSQGQLHPRRQPEFMGTLIRSVAKALAPHVEVSEGDTRLAVQAMAFMVVRFALLTDSEMMELCDAEGEEGRKVVEDFVVRSARRLIRPSDG